jgi:LPS-assembly protein
MREAPTAQNVSDGMLGRRLSSPLREGGFWLIIAVVGVLWLLAGVASAQQRDPTMGLPTLPGGPGSKSAFGKKTDFFGGKPKIDRAQPMYISTDKLIYDDKTNRVIAQGNVEIYYNNYVLTADKVIYDQNLNKMVAEGNVQLKAPNGDISRADRLEATDDFRDAFIQSLSVVTQDDTRIAGEKAIRKEGNVTEFEKAKFTPCRNDPGMPPLWCIGASRIIHDQAAGTITYQDAQFQLYGVTVFYLPYFQTPDPSVKRQSGFLMPSYSTSTTLGISVETPYYFALAPNYDFTFRPTYFSDRGVLWGGEWRHKLADGQYIINLAAIEDATSPALNSNLGQWRGSLQTKGQFSLASWWKFGWDVTLESDESFRRTYKLDSILQTDRVNVAYLQGISERNYFAASLYQFGGLFLDDTVVANSYVHPVIDYSYILGAPVVGGQLSFSAHARSLTRSDGTDDNHFVVQADWKRKMIDPIGQVWTPFASFRGDLYNWTNLRDPDNPAVTLPNDTVALGMAVAGLTYSYPFVAHTASATHIVEPTAQIIVRPNTIDQRKLPNEDARSLVFDDTLLFDIDRFSGYDRLETGTRANLGVQYTLQTSTGLYARFVMGQSIHLAGDNAFALNPGVDAAGVAYYDPLNGLQTNRSDYVAGLYLSPFAGFSLISQGRFDEHDFSLRRQDTALNLSYGPVLAQLGYAFTQFDPMLGVMDNQQEVIATLGLRLTDRWSIVGQVRYDIDDKRPIQDLFQLKYQDECFVLSANYIETFVDNPALEIKPDRTVMLRFELKNLGGGGYSTNALNHIFGDTNQGSLPR